jgi:hypothetical protein
VQIPLGHYRNHLWCNIFHLLTINPSIRFRFPWLISIAQCQEKPQSFHLGKFYCHLFTELGLVHSMPMCIHGLPLSCFLHLVWLYQDLLLVLIFMAPCYFVSVFSACLYFVPFLLIIILLIFPFAMQDTNMINRARFLSRTPKG